MNPSIRPLDAANRIIAAGYPVLPLHWPDPSAPTSVDAEGRQLGGCSCRREDCGSAGKHPFWKAVPNGVKDASRDPERVREWQRRFPRCNIGIATGNGLFVLDYDPRHDGDNSLADLERDFGELATLSVFPGGGGGHLYFRTSEAIGNAAGIRPGLDVRGEGGHVVAPPSLHPSGRRWAWRKGVTRIAEAPTWLLGLIRVSRQGSSGVPYLLPETLRPGERDNSLASLAGTLRRRGLTEEEILPSLLEFNARRCVPPLSEADVKRIAKSIAKKPAALSIVPERRSA